jgi:hypothetical protein
MTALLWVLSLVCSVAYAITFALGDPLHALGLAAFAAVVFAVLSDRSLGRG